MLGKQHICINLKKKRRKKTSNHKSNQRPTIVPLPRHVTSRRNLTTGGPFFPTIRPRHHDLVSFTWIPIRPSHDVRSNPTPLSAVDQTLIFKSYKMASQSPAPSKRSYSRYQKLAHESRSFTVKYTDPFLFFFCFSLSLY